jgi:hypothetical protein
MGWQGVRGAMLRRDAVAMFVFVFVDVSAMRLIEWVRWFARRIPGRCDRWYGALAVEGGVARTGRLV